MSERTRIAVLGGGYGGVEAAKKLYKHFKRNENVEVFLIDRNPYHTLMTELHEIAGSRTEPEAVQVSFRKIFAGTDVTVHTDEIEQIDFDNNVMKSDVATYEYDYLIIGTGGRRSGRAKTRSGSGRTSRNASATRRRSRTRRIGRGCSPS